MTRAYEQRDEEVRRRDCVREKMSDTRDPQVFIFPDMLSL